MSETTTAARYVWVIEDEKYGLLAVFASKKLADAELETGRYHISGAGAVVRRLPINYKPLCAKAGRHV